MVVLKHIESNWGTDTLPSIVKSTSVPSQANTSKMSTESNVFMPDQDFSNKFDAVKVRNQHHPPQSIAIVNVEMSARNILQNGLTGKPLAVAADGLHSNNVILRPKKGRPSKVEMNLRASAKAKNFQSRSKQTKVLLNTVIPFITCNLCKGYLIDATTIVECLHTFCHSCIMIHLRQKQYCPCCELMINQTRPNIKPDAIRQAMVYKLVPGLYEKEIMRRQEFYRAHPEEAKLATPEQRGEDTENLIFSPNEKISLSIEYANLENTPHLDEILKLPIYLLCPASFNVNMLSKFVVLKLGIDSTRFIVDISYKVKTIVLSDGYTLMDVAYIYTWKREAPMRFYFRVRTKETSNEEVPEVPLRRSPSISTHTGVTETTSTHSETCDQSANNNTDTVPKPLPNVETKLKLIKKVEDSQQVSDKKRVVYMVKGPQPDQVQQLSAAAAYVFVEPAPETPNGGDVQIKLPTGTPKYRSLVEKENAKMKKLMQSLSEEKKRLKLQKREASKTIAVSEKKCDSLKMTISKTDAGVRIVQHAVGRDPERKDLISAIGSIANCDRNDTFKKSLFLNAFELTPKKTLPLETTATIIVKDGNTDVKDNGSPPDKLETSGIHCKPQQKDSNRTPSPNAESQGNPAIMSLPAEKHETLITRSSWEERLSQNIPRRKYSSYVKIAPKESSSEKFSPPSLTSPQHNIPSVGSSKIIPAPAAVSTTLTMAPPLAPFIQASTCPPRKKLYKPAIPGPLFNMIGFSQGQFQTMPSPIYMTNANAGSTPIYSPNSPQYSPNFALPQHKEFKYTKFPTYVTNVSMPSQPLNMCGKLVAATAKTGSSSPMSKSIQYLSNLPPPPIFSPSSGMSITTTTTTAGVPVMQNYAKSGHGGLLQGKRKNSSSLGTEAAVDRGKRVLASANGPPSGEDPPEKQRKVQSLLNSCNITFPSSLSITIANESEDQDGSGGHCNKIKNPVNNYIEILKIPSCEPTSCTLDINPQLPLPAVNTSRQQNIKAFATTTASTMVLSQVTPPTTTKPESATMSITPAIPSNMVNVVKEPKETVAAKQTVVSDLKRKSPPTEPVASKRHTPPPIKTSPTLNLQTSTKATEPKVGARSIPKLKPIEKVSNNKQNNTLHAVSTSSLDAQNNAATVGKSNEAFQVEFLKFAKDKKDVVKVSTQASTVPHFVSGVSPIEKKGTSNTVAIPTVPSKPFSNNIQKSPIGLVKIKPKDRPNSSKLQKPKNNKTVLPSQSTRNGNALPPFPVLPQENQQREYAAALVKIAIGMQQQQTLAALQHSQFPTVLSDLILPKPRAARTTPSTPQSPPPPPPSQQMSSLIQQACLMEHFERMKRAGKEALERYAQGIQQEQKTVSQNEKTQSTSSTAQHQATGLTSSLTGPILSKDSTISSPEKGDVQKTSPSNKKC